MSSQFLQTELLNLIQESKRRSTNLRNAAEESLNELKALPSTSESQVSADLLRRPKFPEPFIIACQTRHAKLASIGVICLQRLVISRSLPSERLRDVLDGLKEAMNLNLEIQLKILQSLPPLLQHYSSFLSGELLAAMFEVCAALQASKTAAVSSTAAATFQQLVISIFERVLAEGGTTDPLRSNSVHIDGKRVDVRHFLHDALQVFEDLCRFIDSEQFQFLRTRSLSPTFTLELIENVLINNVNLFTVHSELTQVLQARLMPLIIKNMSEKHTFPKTIRVARILLVLLKHYMQLLTAECEVAMGLLIHLLEPDDATPWKRVLSMEVFRGLYAEPGLVRFIYSMYDEKEGRRNILKDHMACLVRLASESPSLIGAGEQSTAPLHSERSRSMAEEQITLEAGGVAGVIGASASSTGANVSGISSQWSVVRIPYIELLDKTDAPTPPDTYIYTIVLSCVGSLADDLARFILPLTVPELRLKKKNRTTSVDQGSGSAKPVQDPRGPDLWKAVQSSSSKRTLMPINPLDYETHPQLPAVKSCAGVIDSCWPAILATCSTFLYASLDDEFYHHLVRSFQKLAHVAGLLRLSVPRDAFLTTLGKSSVPTGFSSIKSWALSADDSQKIPSNEKKLIGTDVSSATFSRPKQFHRPYFESSSKFLSTRNLLCMRALLNLGTALGPTLDKSAWSIIFVALQHTDLMAGLSSTAGAKPNTAAARSSESAGHSIEIPKINMGSEIIAVQAASAKMLESTGDFSDKVFQGVLMALLSVSETTGLATQRDTLEIVSDISHPSISQHCVGYTQSAQHTPQSAGKHKVEEEKLKFVLQKSDELLRANVERLSSLEEGDCNAWQLLTDSLIFSTGNNEISAALRLKASDIFNFLVSSTMAFSSNDSDSSKNARQVRNLQALNMQVKFLYNGKPPSQKAPSGTVAEIHERCLDTLRGILEQHAETFSEGWTNVFPLISSVFGEPPFEDEKLINVKGTDGEAPAGESLRLVRAAYKCLHLIASDFFAILPSLCRLELVYSLSNFASQQQDFNISLTTTSFFWNVSDFLRGEIDQFSIESYADASVSEAALATLAKDDNPSISRGSLWLLLLLRIVKVTTDKRSEIRNSAVHTLLRIFDAYGQQLASRAWHLCLNRVLFRMADEIQSELTRFVENGRYDSDELRPWVETAVVMVSGFSGLIANFYAIISQDEEFDTSWNRLLKSFRSLITMQRLELSAAVFSSLKSILLRVESLGGLTKSALQSAWSLWRDGHPAAKTELINLEQPNQEAALAYLQAFRQIYQLYNDAFTREHIEQILQHIRLLAWNSISSQYSTDIDRPSELQAMIIICMKTICMDKNESQPEILLCLADCADSALTQWDPKGDPRKPTFIAFSKAAIDLLSWYIAEHGVAKNAFSSGSLTITLEHLAALIARKYEWQGKGQERILWKKATTSSLDILKVAIPHVEEQYSNCGQSDIARFWECVIDIAQGIISASGYQIRRLPRANVLADESFDIESFNKLKTLIIPSLGASAIPDTIRRDFACALFLFSFIYPPQHSDLPSALLDDDILQGIYDIRAGKTFDSAPTLRPNMAYVLMDTMFELSSITCAQTERSNATAIRQVRGNLQRTVQPTPISLAQSVSPYLILRCAVALKTYIADQPLRGLMPQPTPARKALLHLLRGMVRLQSEPAAIQEPPAVRVLPSPLALSAAADKHTRKHLEWIYPLVVRGIQVAGKERDDGLVLQALGEALDMIGRRV